MKHSKNRIRYQKKNSLEESERTIIQTTKVPENIKAIDVSDLTEDQVEKLLVLLDEYDQYINNHLKTAFSFENWVEMKDIDDVPQVKWRTFNLWNTTYLD